MKQHKKTKGQALVEFALMATLLFFLLAAAIDIGLAFFAVQGLRNAAQEGAQYGSDNLTINPADGKTQIVDVKEVQKRVRYEGGDESVTHSGFVNLLDLNNDGVDDAADNISQADVIDTHILVESLMDDGTGQPDPSQPCPEPQKQQLNSCFIVVTVKAQHRSFFPLAPIFGDTYTLVVRQSNKIRAA